MLSNAEIFPGPSEDVRQHLRTSVAPSMGPFNGSLPCYERTNDGGMTSK